MTERQLVIVGALMMLIGVGAGAFGAHGLKRVLSADMLAIWQTAVLYQLIHALGLLLIAALSTRIVGPLPGWSGLMMLAGIILFSGSLYILALSGVKWLGAITPLGGVAFIVAWALLMFAAWRHL
ncbi:MULTISPECIES: DUF423 domain-containing protein [Alcaligenaceae]|jgi:uncharacterized membrane protein YgdD (TMEM256/DUF423 family)|uniref:DUF423 domain-containing protein n=1 Tax=Neopusillimonas maritima TaxID=2026239 RepID=A0ABX9MUX4_9BURK|nr:MULTISPECIES: DUF423 domain-containing protein [Alcaligenaceae]QIM50036.1 DUF423 domain-containing protein [Pusillimonas sp. DMV24BSW_D]RII82730.1 hypothetical protein CJO09_09050 [Neopusillimonas maritima]